MSRYKLNIFIAIAVVFLIGSGIYIYSVYRSNTAVDDNTNVILWYVEGDTLHDGFEDIAKEYNSLKVSNNISVTARGFISSEAIEKALKKVDDKDAPDMIACDVNEAALLYDEGYTVKCSNYIVDWASEELDEDFIGCASTEQKLIAVPYAANAQMMIVNNGIIPDADKIDSIEKLCKLSTKYYKENGRSMLTIADYASFFKTAMAQLGESFDAVNPRYSESESCKSIYNMLAETAYDRGLTVSADPVSDVVSGKIPCAIVSTSDIMSSADKIKGSVGIYSCPCMKDGKQVYSLSVECICICKSDSNRQIAASEFIRWFTSKEINHKFVADSGYIPAVGDMSMLKSEHEVFGELRNVIGTLSLKSEHASIPANAEYAKNYGEFINTMQSVMDSLS